MSTSYHKLNPRHGRERVSAGSMTAAAHRRVVTGLPDPPPSLFEMSLDLITVSGFDGYYKKVNPAMTEILGWSWTELRSEPILHFVHPEDRARTEAEFERVQDHGVSIRHFENRMRRRLGITGGSPGKLPTVTMDEDGNLTRKTKRKCSRH